MHRKPPAPATAADPGRRRAARRLAITLALTGLPWPAMTAGPAATLTERQRLGFAAVCDTLVPADPLTPAASDLGVVATILADIEGDADARRLLASACEWLDARSDGDFAVADVEVREAALEAMSRQPWESPAGRFFQLARNTVMAEYYAQPAAWRGLALDRPPQPIGFPGALR